MTRARSLTVSSMQWVKDGLSLNVLKLHIYSALLEESSVGSLLEHWKLWIRKDELYSLAGYPLLVGRVASRLPLLVY